MFTFCSSCKVRRNKRKNLTKQERDDIYKALLQSSNNGTLRKISTRLVSQTFNCSMRTVERIWERAKACIQAGTTIDVQSTKPMNCGKKKIQADFAPLAEIPLNERSTIRAIVSKIGMKKSTVHKRFKEGNLRRHSNCLKPSLREDNKRDRLNWCLSMLEEDSLPNQPKFKYLDNVIHVDEKWFYMTKKCRNIYLLPGEEDSYRTVQNKNSIDKIMFPAGVAQPRFDNEGNCIFDGKIGVWAFVRKVSLLCLLYQKIIDLNNLIC
jgi:DNA invertase Pin-like site-specific DNA recombinase